MARTKRTKADAAPAPAAGFTAPPDDGGLSIDRLAQAFAAMMGTADPQAEQPPADVVQVDASPDLDEAAGGDDDDAARVTPLSILEALLFVGLPGGRPLSSRSVASLIRGVRPEEVDDLAVNCSGGAARTTVPMRSCRGTMAG